MSDLAGQSPPTYGRADWRSCSRKGPATSTGLLRGKTTYPPPPSRSDRPHAGRVQSVEVVEEGGGAIPVSSRSGEKSRHGILEGGGRNRSAARGCPRFRADSRRSLVLRLLSTRRLCGHSATPARPAPFQAWRGFRVSWGPWAGGKLPRSCPSWRVRP